MCLLRKQSTQPLYCWREHPPTPTTQNARASSTMLNRRTPSYARRPQASPVVGYRPCHTCGARTADTVAAEREGGEALALRQRPRDHCRSFRPKAVVRQVETRDAAALPHQRKSASHRAPRSESITAQAKICNTLVRHEHGLRRVQCGGFWRGAKVLSRVTERR